MSHDHTVTMAARFLRLLSTRRPAVEQPAAADVPVVPDVREDVAAVAREVRPAIAYADTAPEWSPEPPPFPGSATVPPMPDWAPGAPFGMARWER